jgi:transposase
MGEDAMGTAKLRVSKRRQLRKLLQQTRDVRLYRRLLAVLECDRGTPIGKVAELLGVSRQSVHNWIVRFRERGDAAELRDAPHSGRPARADDAFDLLLRTLLLLSPESFGYHATHWTVRLLRDQVRQNTGEDYSDDTIRRGLHRLGYVWKRPRYVLMPDPEREKKTPHSPRPVWFAQAQCSVG